MSHWPRTQLRTHELSLDFPGETDSKASLTDCYNLVFAIYILAVVVRNLLGKLGMKNEIHTTANRRHAVSDTLQRSIQEWQSSWSTCSKVTRLLPIQRDPGLSQLTYYKRTCLGQPPLQTPSGYIIARKISEKNFRTKKSWCLTRINIGDFCLEVLFYLKSNKIKYSAHRFWLIDSASRGQKPKAAECFVSISMHRWYWNPP